MRISLFFFSRVGQLATRGMALTTSFMTSGETCSSIRDACVSTATLGVLGPYSDKLSYDTDGDLCWGFRMDVDADGRVDPIEKLPFYPLIY